ncbi:MAG: antitoxin [Acidimicrobiia bacterium]
MGLFDKRKIDKIKGLAEKNAPKIAQGVDKATDVVNKKTKGKFADKLNKVDEAAHKFARQSSSNAPAEAQPGATAEPTADKPES